MCTICGVKMVNNVCFLEQFHGRSVAQQVKREYIKMDPTEKRMIVMYWEAKNSRHIIG